MGNHDNDPYVQGDAPGQLSYCRTLGPNYYSFNLGKVHYVVLDDIDWINTGGSDCVLGSRDYNRVVSLAQMTWLAWWSVCMSSSTKITTPRSPTRPRCRAPRVEPGR